MALRSFPHRLCQGGFTLLELLVALTILSILSFLTYRGISTLLEGERKLGENTRRVQAIDRFLSEFETDMLFAAPTPVRNSLASLEPALLANSAGAQGDFRINLTRFSPATDTPPYRVSYIFSTPEIKLATSSLLDSVPLNSEEPFPVLDRLQSAAVRFLDVDGRWTITWPPTGRTDAIPKAVELTIVLDDFGTITRLIARP